MRFLDKFLQPKTKKTEVKTPTGTKIGAIGMAGMAGMAPGGPQHLDTPPTPSNTNTPPSEERHEEKPGDAVDYYRKQGLLSGAATKEVSDAIEKATKEQREAADKEIKQNTLEHNKVYDDADESKPDPNNPPLGYKTVYAPDGTFSFVLKTGEDYRQEGAIVDDRATQNPYTKNQTPPLKITPEYTKHKPEKPIDKEVSDLEDTKKIPVITPGDEIKTPVITPEGLKHKPEKQTGTGTGDGLEKSKTPPTMKDVDKEKNKNRGYHPQPGDLYASDKGTTSDHNQPQGDFWVNPDTGEKYYMKPRPKSNPGEKSEKSPKHKPESSPRWEPDDTQKNEPSPYYQNPYNNPQRFKRHKKFHYNMAQDDITPLSADEQQGIDTPDTTKKGKTQDDNIKPDKQLSPEEREQIQQQREWEETSEATELADTEYNEYTDGILSTAEQIEEIITEIKNTPKDKLLKYATQLARLTATLTTLTLAAMQADTAQAQPGDWNHPTATPPSKSFKMGDNGYTGGRFSLKPTASPTANELRNGRGRIRLSTTPGSQGYIEKMQKGTGRHIKLNPRFGGLPKADADNPFETPQTTPKNQGGLHINPLDNPDYQGYSHTQKSGTFKNGNPYNVDIQVDMPFGKTGEGEVETGVNID